MRRMRNLMTVLALAALPALIAGCGIGGAGGAGGCPLAQYDTNNDGQLSADELAAGGTGLESALVEMQANPLTMFACLSLIQNTAGTGL